MIDFIPMAGSLLAIAYRESTKPRDEQRLKYIAVRLREAHDVLQRVTGGVAARQQNRRFWAAVYKHGVPTAEVSALPRLRHPVAAFGCWPTPRAIRWALDVLHNDVTPRHIPYSELLALRRFLESQLPEEP